MLTIHTKNRKPGNLKILGLGGSLFANRVSHCHIHGQRNKACDRCLSKVMRLANGRIDTLETTDFCFSVLSHTSLVIVMT